MLNRVATTCFATPLKRECFGGAIQLKTGETKPRIFVKRIGAGMKLVQGGDAIVVKVNGCVVHRGIQSGGIIRVIQFKPIGKSVEI